MARGGAKARKATRISDVPLTLAMATYRPGLGSVTGTRSTSMLR